MVHVHVALVLLDTVVFDYYKPPMFISCTQQGWYTLKSADQYLQLRRSDGRNILIYAHTTSRTLLKYDVRLRSLKLPAPKAGNFVGITLPYFTKLRKAA